MKTAIVTVEESHYGAHKAADYPYNVWLEGRWFHLETEEETVELGDEITVKYHPADQFATVDRKAKLPLTAEDRQAKKIYDVLGSQRFADWYKDDGQFGCHITGDAYGASNDIPSDKEILDYIKRTFLV